jgi:hypothetical protein
VWWWRRSPEPIEQPPDHQILFGFRQRTQCRPRLATLQKHGVEAVVGFQEPHGWVSVPETQTLDLVRALHVRHAKLQYRGHAVLTHRRRNPGAAHFCAVERRPERYRPATLQISEDGWQPMEPRRPLRRSGATSCEPGWDRKHRFLPPSLSAVTRSGFDRVPKCLYHRRAGWCSGRDRDPAKQWSNSTSSGTLSLSPATVFTRNFLPCAPTPAMGAISGAEGAVGGSPAALRQYVQRRKPFSQLFGPFAVCDERAFGRRDFGWLGGHLLLDCSLLLRRTFLWVPLCRGTIGKRHAP